jgi:hypothetical protein
VFEGYRKHSILFERLGASIVAASVDSLDDTKLLADGKCFPNRGKAMPYTFCYGVTTEIAQTLGAYWYYHSEGKDKYYIMGVSKDYMQPAEFCILSICTLILNFINYLSRKILLYFLVLEQ